MKQLETIRDYYAGKIEQFGATHKGADWNSTDSQELRFEQLLKVCGNDEEFSLNDLGCGYGALYDYAQARKPKSTYCGYDICPEMIDAAGKRLGSRPNLKLIEGAQMQMADYTVASGILHVRLDASNEDWLAHVHKTIEQMDKASTRGFALNLLTSYSDADKMRDDLFYADPCYFFDYLKKKLCA